MSGAHFMQATGQEECVLVFGGTGKQGGATIRKLLELKAKLGRNLEIRAFVRNAASASAAKLSADGVTLVEGSFENKESIRAALSGVDRVFLNTMYNTLGGESWEKELSRGMNVADELEKASWIQQVVYSTITHTEGHNESRAKSRIERRLRESGVPLTTVTSSFYLENFIDIWPPIRKWFGLWGKLEWRWFTSSEAAFMPHCCLDDFGLAVAEIMSCPVTDHLNEQYLVTTAELRFDEVLESLGKGLGESITRFSLKSKILDSMPIPKEAAEEIEFYSHSILDARVIEKMMFNSDDDGVRRRKVYKYHDEQDTGLSYVERWARTNRDHVVGVDFRKSMFWLFRTLAGLKVKVFS